MSRGVHSHCARRRLLLPALVGLLLLGACGNNQEPGPFAVLADLARAEFGGSGAEALPPPIAQDGHLAVSAQLAASADQPVVGVVIEDRNAQALLTPSGASGPHMTWLSADRASFTLVAGSVLVRTSGLGNDLQNADVTQLLAAMAAGQPAELQRKHIVLTRDFQREALDFTCTLTPAGRAGISLAGQRRDTMRFNELCEGEGHSFTNSYWFDQGAGMIVQSVQWVHPQTGRVHLQLIGHP